MKGRKSELLTKGLEGKRIVEEGKRIVEEGEKIARTRNDELKQLTRLECKTALVKLKRNHKILVVKESEMLNV